MPIYRFGNEAQKQEWLPQLASGEALAGFGLTEPGAGSDAGGTKTTAKLVDGEWVINGNKQFITNSGTDITRLVTVTAVTGNAGRGSARGRSADAKSPPSWCRPPRRASPPSPPTTRSAGTPPTPIR